MQKGKIMQKLIIIGNLTKDPESRTTTSGKEVCNFTVAVNRRQKDANGNNAADFFKIAAWGELGKSCQQYLSKGRKVAVVGQVSVSTYQAQDGSTRANLDVLAQEVEFLTPHDGGHGSSEQTAQASPAPAAQPVNFADRDLPF